MTDAKIEVHGLRQLADGSAKLADGIGKTAQERFQRVAEARASMVRARVPRVSGALAASVVAENGTVGMGDETVPYAGWIDFGGTREGGRNSWAERPYLPEGRYLFPTAFAGEPELETEAANAATDEIRGFSWPSPS